MSDLISRRTFVHQAALTGAAAAALTKTRAVRAASKANNQVVVSVMGLGRGKGHVRGYQGVSNVEIGYLCDVDANRLGEGLRMVEGKQKRAAKGVGDFRRMLEDKDLDVVSIATPNFWHTPAALLAMQAGKHVYVEKPGSHNAREGEMIVAAARKYKRVCQMGNQRRSYPSMIEGIGRLHDGAIGQVLFSRTYYFNTRPGIGKGKPATPPEELNWDIWQGPTPERPFVDNLVHYNWHWRWHYGGGEMANNGIHALDIARWGLKVTYPKRVSYTGNRYHYDDDQETPDTGVATYDFGHCGATWEQSSCHRRKPEEAPFCSFAGSEGFMSFTSAGWTLYDLKGKEVAKDPGKAGDVPHFTNFIDCIFTGDRPNSDIEEGQTSTRWCHLANIAWRTGQTLDVNPKTGKIIDNPKAEALWGRQYRPGWEPKV